VGGRQGKEREPGREGERRASAFWRNPNKRPRQILTEMRRHEGGKRESSSRGGAPIARRQGGKVRASYQRNERGLHCKERSSLGRRLPEKKSASDCNAYGESKERCTPSSGEVKEGNYLRKKEKRMSPRKDKGFMGPKKKRGRPLSAEEHLPLCQKKGGEAFPPLETPGWKKGDRRSGKRRRAA